MSDISKDALKMIKDKTGKNVTEQSIKKMASEVNPSALNDEKALRNLIKKIAGSVNTPVSESTINQIVRAVQSGGAGNLEQLIKRMTGK